MTSKGSVITINVKTALDEALAEGNLSATSHGILVENLDTLSTLQGASPEALPEDRVTLFIPVMDESGSRALEAALMRTEYNRMLDALNASKARDTILVSSWMFNSIHSMLHGFVPLDQAERLNDQNYNPTGGTAMYATMLDVLTNTAAYVTTLLAAGNRVKIVIALITDGEDNESQHLAKKVKQVISELLDQERYVFDVIAFGSGYAQAAAADMGIPQKNVLEYGKGEKDIRSAFELESSSVIRQSQTQIGGSQNFFTS